MVSLLMAQVWPGTLPLDLTLKKAYVRPNGGTVYLDPGTHIAKIPFCIACSPEINLR